jgi:hypothetical protein
LRRKRGGSGGSGGGGIADLWRWRANELERALPLFYIFLSHDDIFIVR